MISIETIVLTLTTIIMLQAMIDDTDKYYDNDNQIILITLLVWVIVGYSPLCSAIGNVD